MNYLLNCTRFNLQRHQRILTPWRQTCLFFSTKKTLDPTNQSHDSSSIRNSNNTTSTHSKMGRRYPNPRLRTHLISLMDGDYSEDDEENDQKDTWQNTSTSTSTSNTMIIKEEDLDEDVKLRHQLEAEALEMAQREEEQKAKWAENAKPPLRVPEIDDFGRAYGRGGRKTSTARVWIMPGEGHVTVNRRTFLDFFPRESDREMILSPLVATNTCGKFDVVVQVEGGGVTGKAGAVRHGLSRALEKYCPDYRPPLKRLGFMTRDARMVEEKKIGLKKARKAPQWVRR